jgi:putative CocE/NonD family hydrolase
MQWHVKIPLRDGVRLNATLYLPPEPSGPSPAIFTLTPYIGQRYHEEAMYFAARGYAFLTVDVRGRGDSEGGFHPYINEARDGHDVTEWIAAETWCNGKVTLWGGSYGGYVQWMTASERPPHLATLVPFASPYIGVDFPMRNNLPTPYLLQWLTLVSGRVAQDAIFWRNERFWGDRFRRMFESGAPFQTFDAMLGNPSRVFQEWVAHPTQDAYWDRFNPSADDYAALDLPVLTITGIYDGDQAGALMHYRQHLANAAPAARARHYLVIGPWDHGGTRMPKAEFAGLKVGPAGLLDMRELHLQWYAWTMQGGSRPAFLEKNVAYYVLGAERWRYADSLDTVTRSVRTLYMSSSGDASSVFASGALVYEPGRDGADEYVYDPRDLSIAAIEAEWTDPACLRPSFPVDDLTDQRLVFAHEGRQLVYHSEAFEADTEITGFFRMIAWISIDQPDTDFRVTVYEIDASGRSLLLSTDSLRARYREGLRAEMLVRTSEPLRYEFASFSFVSRMVRKGSRLRLTLGPINSIYSQKNHNSGKAVAGESMQDARPVRVRLWHGHAYPSALHVPFGEQP